MPENKDIYMTKAVGHYDKLFTFPKYWVLLVLLLLTSLSGSIVAFTITQLTMESIFAGLLFALKVFFFPTIIIDYISRETITKTEPIFDLRRSTSLSVVISVGWMVILIIGSILQVFFQFSHALYYATFFSICVTLAIRFFILSTVTQLSGLKLILSTLIHPITISISNLLFWNNWSIQLLVALIFSSVILVGAIFLFLAIINRKGRRVVGINTILLFKGFLVNWIRGLVQPLEGYFDKLGVEVNTSINLFVFGNHDKVKTIMVIPAIHPGPFNNLGSSGLPELIQWSIEKKYTAITAVPHGPSGHELDLTSQSQCDKVIEEILKINPLNFTTKASKLVRIVTKKAQAACQFFGDTALLTLTCAPNSMEDIPSAVGSEIIQKGKLLGIKQIAIIDAHNSINTAKTVPPFSKEEVQELVFVAVEALKYALKEVQQSFYVGVSKVVPKEFTTNQGIGPGGIVALVLLVQGQKIVYIIVDGNNMIVGLRDKIIHALSMYFDECEILTTDTHIVNAISTIRRGYYSVGEAIDHEVLISYIKDTAMKAKENVEKVEVSFTQVNINNIRVLGEEKLVDLSMLIDITLGTMKWVAPLIFVPAFIAAILPFIFI